MQTYAIAKIGLSRGRPRVWMQGNRPARAGFIPGVRYNVTADRANRTLILEVVPNGVRMVSRKAQGDRVIPVIDLNSAELLSLFEGMNTVRLIMDAGRILILPSASDLAKAERTERLHTKISQGQPLAVGSLSHGGGVLSHALHAGLADGGIASRLVFANDIRDDLLDQADAHNNAWDSRTMVLSAPMQELAFDPLAMTKLPVVDLLEMGLPCSGASLSGKAKRGAGHAEAHPEVGHLVVSALAIIAKVQPAIILLENVKQYANTASMWILRHQLRDMGYQLHETVLDSSEWNVIEHRERLCVVAVTEGLKFDFARLERPEYGEESQPCIADILDEEVPESRWRDMAGLKAKEARYQARLASGEIKGTGFAMQVLASDATCCPVITKGYSKVRSTDPKLRHPHNPDLLRQFTPTEHARIKGCPPEIITGLPESTAHQLLGQSVCYAPFRAVGKLLSEVVQTMQPIQQDDDFRLVG